VFVLKLLEYQWLARNLTIELYMGLLAIFFTVVGAWAGWKLTTRKKQAEPVVINETALKALHISNRELEVLNLMAAGHSNQEIAEKLFVSFNTVKTHSSNLFQKLEVNRRTQAIQKAKTLGLLACVFALVLLGDFH